MIRLQRGDEEVTAQRTIVEQQAEAEARAREEGTVERCLEAQARHEAELSQQARATVHNHNLEEKAYDEARFHHLEANLQYRQALHNHNLEEKAIAQSRLLHQQLEESEQHYKTTIQREAENFANNLQQELQYHMTSNAQSQSLLSAERDKFRKEYDVQAEKWSHYSEEITQQAEEALQGLTDEHNAIGEELAQVHNDLFHWTEWYQEGLPPQTQAEDGMGPEEVKELFAALNQDEPQASPLTTAVQQDVLSSHLPPTTLPSFRTRVSGKVCQSIAHRSRYRSESRLARGHSTESCLGRAPGSTFEMRGAHFATTMSHGLPNSGPVTVAQTPMVSPTEMPQDDPKREKLYLPKLSIKAGDATTLTRTINEWLQKTTLALNTCGGKSIVHHECIHCP